MADDKSKPKLRRLDPQPVDAPLHGDTPFKLIGSGFCPKIVVYVSRDSDGEDAVKEIKITPDSSISTDKVLSLIATPEFGAPIKTDLWVAIKLNGAVIGALPGFRVA